MEIYLSAVIQPKIEIHVAQYDISAVSIRIEGQFLIFAIKVDADGGDFKKA
jgi:hypothetical protein